VVWQSAYPVIAFNMWRHYGDTAVLKTHWRSLVAFMVLLLSKQRPLCPLLIQNGHFTKTGSGQQTPDGTLDENPFTQDYIERVSDPTTKLTLTGGLSDWVPPGGNGHGPFTDARQCSAFYALLDTKHMADMAAAIGAKKERFWEPCLD
jgi:hypothetical protein